MTPRKIYLASSWKNEDQPGLVAALRLEGHEVYDFREPEAAFRWVDIADIRHVSGAFMRNSLLTHPLAQAGFAHDIGAMQWADTGVLLLPCGKSSHLEIGWLAGAGKRTCIMWPDGAWQEPELMYLCCNTIVTTAAELTAWLREGV